MDIDKIQDLLNWWNDNYTLIADYDLTEKKYLGDSQNKICRFCGRKEPEVKFRKIAHAIPESIENINLFSNYECDECNKKFGDNYNHGRKKSGIKYSLSYKRVLFNRYTRFNDLGSNI